MGQINLKGELRNRRTATSGRAVDSARCDGNRPHHFQHARPLHRMRLEASYRPLHRVRSLWWVPRRGRVRTVSKFGKPAVGVCVRYEHSTTSTTCPRCRAGRQDKQNDAVPSMQHLLGQGRTPRFPTQGLPTDHPRFARCANLHRLWNRCHAAICTYH